MIHTERETRYSLRHRDGDQPQSTAKRGERGSPKKAPNGGGRDERRGQWSLEGGRPKGPGGARGKGMVEEGGETGGENRAKVAFSC